MDAEEVLIWPHSQDGQYSCKSGYRFLKDEEAMDNAQDDAITDLKLWKGIWTLQVPNKVKNLLWRACRNALPTKEALFAGQSSLTRYVIATMKHMRCLYMLCGIVRN